MKILITGYKGMLGSILFIKLQEQGHEVTGVDLPAVDITDKEQLDRLFLKNDFDFIYNCAAFTNVDLCESEFEKALEINFKGVKNLIEAAKKNNIPLVHISTDYVFDGRATTPYKTNTPTNPLSAYGKSKAGGEKAILESGHNKYFIVRTAWLYGQNGKNFVETIIKNAGEKKELKIVNDQRGAPTFAADLADFLVKLATSDKYGIYHFTNKGETTWYDFAKEFLTYLNINIKLTPCSSTEYPRPAVRPGYSVLDLTKTEQDFGIKIPAWQEALKRYLHQREQK